MFHTRDVERSSPVLFQCSPVKLFFSRNARKRFTIIMDDPHIMYMISILIPEKVVTGEHNPTVNGRPDFVNHGES